jgi:hypothetical protein
MDESAYKLQSFSNARSVTRVRLGKNIFIKSRIVIYTEDVFNLDAMTKVWMNTTQ